MTVATYPAWLSALVDEYDGRQDFSPRYIKRIKDAFGDRDAAVLSGVVDEYTRKNEWFAFATFGNAVQKAERFTDDSIVGAVDMLDSGPTEEEALAILAEWDRCDVCGTQLNSEGVCLYAFQHEVAHED